MKIIAFVLLVFSLTSQANALKIGYINIDYVVSSSPQFAQANQSIIDEFQPKEDQILLLDKHIKTLADEYNQNYKTFTEENRKAAITKITQLQRQLKLEASALEEQLTLKNTQELRKIQDLINQVIQEIAEEEKFDLVLYQEVAYVSKKINITKTVSETLRLLFE